MKHQDDVRKDVEFENKHFVLTTPKYSVISVYIRYVQRTFVKLWDQMCMLYSKYIVKFVKHRSYSYFKT